MMENNIFSFNRFGLLLKKDILENWKSNLIYFVVLVGILFLAFMPESMERYGSTNLSEFAISRLNTTLLTIACVLFLVLGTVFASTIMNPINGKTKRISYLMSPSSSFEKYFSRWMLVVVIYAIGFVMAFFLADSLRVFVCSILYPNAPISYINLSILMSRVFKSDNTLPLAISFYLFSQSLFILGAGFWQKNSFIKTFATGATIVIAFFSFCSAIIKILFNVNNEFFNAMENMFRGVFDSDENALCGVILVLLLFTVFNWVLSYFRFKETEIINRW